MPSISFRPGEVVEISERFPGGAALSVLVDGRPAAAINYEALTGPVAPGDAVLLNVTAVELGLGTGGYHFVMANLGGRGRQADGPGHIMKLRYTPLQLKVFAVEEEGSPYRPSLEACEDLAGMPVVIVPLHSLLAPAVAGVKAFDPALKTAYLMTDAGALPLAWSRLVRELKEKGLLAATLTAGQAFGGDFEVVNVYSGLLAAKAVVGADVTVVGMGPGNAGTNTVWGFSGLEQGEIVNAVNILGGKAIAVPRLSFAEPRRRHFGLSHHTLTALGRVALTPAFVALPPLSQEQERLVRRQIEAAGLAARHRLVKGEGRPALELLARLGLRVASMGRTMAEDEAFFAAAGAAGCLAAALVRGVPEAVATPF